MFIVLHTDWLKDHAIYDILCSVRPVRAEALLLLVTELQHTPLPHIIYLGHHFAATDATYSLHYSSIGGCVVEFLINVVHLSFGRKLQEVREIASQGPWLFSPGLHIPTPRLFCVALG
jgi:hypothetical protein